MLVQFFRKHRPVHLELPSDVAVKKFLNESNKIEGIEDQKSLEQATFAFEHLIKYAELNGGHILKAHKILMLNQPLRPNERGYWRRVPVYIGGNEAMDWHDIKYAMSELIDQMNQEVQRHAPNLTIKQLEHNAWANHIRFEKIHPFVDGNGRVGRMLLNWQRLRVGLPMVIIEAVNRGTYYEMFKQ
jgi:Fic family protein